MDNYNKIMPMFSKLSAVGSQPFGMGI